MRLIVQYDYYYQTHFIPKQYLVMLPDASYVYLHMCFAIFIKKVFQDRTNSKYMAQTKKKSTKRKLLLSHPYLGVSFDITTPIKYNIYKRILQHSYDTPSYTK